MSAALPSLVVDVASEITRGLAQTPKSLPSYLFYDAAGSELFEQITALPEYYLTRTELRILRERSTEIAEALPPLASVIELGAGTAAKTTVLLRALRSRTEALTYLAMDISETALRQARARLAEAVPDVSVRTHVRDYSSQELPPSRPPRLVLYLGSSIGNFDPLDAVALLTRLARQLGPSDALLLGTDLRKPASVLLPAYDDAQGVTARFNLNMLARLNREFSADFNLAGFRHVALWNDSESRIEMHLQSMRRQMVHIRDLDMRVRFEAGERLHTENSYKYTIRSVEHMFKQSGLRRARTWTDADQWFALHLARLRL
jgi:dimethylhistidine N-methyltransferase